MIEIESKWENTPVFPSTVGSISYLDKNYLMLNTLSDGNTNDIELLGFAATKLFRMTKCRSTEFHKAFVDEDDAKLEKLCGIMTAAIRDRPDTDPLIMRVLKGDGAVKSIVGKGYIPIDMEELEAHAEQILEEGGMHEFCMERHKTEYARGHDVTRYVVLNNDRKTPEVGDLMGVGLQIKNNELGTRGVSVSLFVQRLDCLNGMVSLKTEQTLQATHLGNKEALLNEFDTVATKIVDSAWDVLEWVDKSSQIELTQVEMSNFIDHIIVDEKISGKVGSKIKNAIEKGNYGANKTNMWGLINAITGVSSHDVSHGVKDKLEVIASNLLDLKDTDQIQKQLVKLEVPQN